LPGGDERWPGVGHNSVLLDEKGDWLVYHGYDAENEGMIIRQLRWGDEDWTVVGARVGD